MICFLIALGFFLIDDAPSKASRYADHQVHIMFKCEFLPLSIQVGFVLGCNRQVGGGMYSVSGKENAAELFSFLNDSLAKS